MSKPCICVCITSRDGRIPDEVLLYANLACQFAQRNGIACTLRRSKDQYSVACCRNRAVHDFLNVSGFTHLLFVDDDVLLPEEAVFKLAQAAEKPGRDMVCGCYPGIRDDGDEAKYLYVMVRALRRDWYRTWFAGEVEAETCGTGCMMIARHVFEAVGHPWFRWVESRTPKEFLVVSDDADFCDRARALGFRLFAQGDVRCGHKKTIDLATLVPPEASERPAADPEHEERRERRGAELVAG